MTISRERKKIIQGFIDGADKHPTVVFEATWVGIVQELLDEVTRLEAGPDVPINVLVPRVYIAQDRNYWYWKQNPITGEASPMGPFYSREEANQSITDDYRQLVAQKRGNNNVVPT